MLFNTVNVVGVLCSDPHLPARMYLTEDGGLTKDLKKAKLVDHEVLDLAQKEVRAYSPNVFSTEVIVEN
jgi:hypothetical protein